VRAVDAAAGSVDFGVFAVDDFVAFAVRGAFGVFAVDDFVAFAARVAFGDSEVGVAAAAVLPALPVRPALPVLPALAALAALPARSGAGFGAGNAATGLMPGSGASTWPV